MELQTARLAPPTSRPSPFKAPPAPTPEENAKILSEVRARLAEPADHSFIRSHLAESWWRFWTFRSPKPDRSSSLWPHVERVLHLVLPRSQAMVVEHKGRIVAWSIIDRYEPLVHYAFTIQPLRRMGICRSMLSELERPWRYWADTAPGVITAHHLGGEFDPFALTFLKESP